VDRCWFGASRGTRVRCVRAGVAGIRRPVCWDPCPGSTSRWNAHWSAFLRRQGRRNGLETTSRLAAMVVIDRDPYADRKKTSPRIKCGRCVSMTWTGACRDGMAAISPQRSHPWTGQNLGIGSIGSHGSSLDSAYHGVSDAGHPASFFWGVRSCLYVKSDSVHSCTETVFIFQEILRAMSDFSASLHSIVDLWPCHTD
jgi:hypothetical protein